MECEKIQEFEDLTIHYLDSLYCFALNLSGEKDQAEDLVQDTYLRAYRFYDLYDPGTNYKAWLFTILRNIFINRYHERAREIFISHLYVLAEEENEIYEPPDGPSFTVRSEMEKGIFRADVEKALAALPERFRLVIVLKHIEGFNYKEISQILGCPMGTVMSRLSRGRFLLKRILTDYNHDRCPRKARLRKVLMNVDHG